MKSEFDTHFLNDGSDQTKTVAARHPEPREMINLFIPVPRTGVVWFHVIACFEKN